MIIDLYQTDKKDAPIKNWWETEKAKEQLLKMTNEKFRFSKGGKITERETEREDDH